MLRTDRLIRLYESDAAGMLDAELVDDVGWRLWERLSDVLRVNRGDVRCPSCGTDLHVQDPFAPEERVATCSCGWSVTVAEYQASKRKRDLHGNCPAYASFVERFPKAATPRERMMLIDGVIHELHLTMQGDPSNFAARNFIEGSRPTIVALIEELALGPGSNIAAGARARWEAQRDRYREKGF
jgi:hypothetical protein